jgi:hypothetical protein
MMMMRLDSSTLDVGMLAVMELGTHGISQFRI